MNTHNIVSRSLLLAAAVVTLATLACRISGISSEEQSPREQQPRPTDVNGPTPTPRGVRNPTGPVKMGESILAGDFSLVVDDFSVKSDNIYLTLVIQNVGGTKHVFRYQRSTISVEDDLGNVYKPEYTTTGLYEDVQVEIEPGEAVSFRSTFAGARGSTVIASYTGVISAQASKLLIIFNGFGPYNDITVEINL